MAEIALTDPILSPLHRVIARRRARTLARIAVSLALSVTVALLVVIALDRFGRVSIDAPPVLLAVGLATLLTAGCVAWMRRRTAVEEAFFIDKASGLDEAYGTAVELVQNPGSLNRPVPAELVGSVRNRLDGLAPSRLVKLMTPGFALALVLTAATGVAAWWLFQIPAATTPQPAVEAQSEGLPADSETISTIAEILAEDAQARDDLLLGAVARTLAERAQTAGAEGLSDALAREINDLLDQAAATYGENPPAWLGDSEGTRLNELEAGLEAMRNATAPSPAQPLEPPQGRGDAVQATPEGPGMYEARPELAEQYANRSDDERLADAEIVSNGEPPTDLGGGSSGEGPQLMEPQQLQSIGSIPVGAALESGRGLSNAAGLGEQDMQADDAFAQLGAEPGEDLVVSAEPQSGGSRIRIEIVPQAAEDGGASAANAIGGQTGSGSSEPVARDFIPLSARDITARYFERPAQ
ncbi:hypothetical protein [Pelagibacterium halotolerans]|uniref:Uncharacterized protein n=1 Tax=Pelagibacterium halotolerans (strain DSM 22347 / JCM 15775 / CGMCC 1.7692 / B2) TaxID=1082931 RepID=G4RGP2_PELHB|nr:hypothetical protein [Pelagibacterium halotolerans]AEQ52081.1 hypothetical protein KKY_2071 [Pelagibacterium halotolerans B2]QJR18145.1 hypothetical protein HKM20_06670 [Pelagibacterium halotolerans]SDZ83055.1 hypothetical protein SAMN05428936_101142 [Pelagibacterium halotolerans]